MAEQTVAPNESRPYHDQVRAFRTSLILDALTGHRGNRTHAARALGLQRTYLVRLMRDLNIAVPPRGRAVSA